MSDATHPDCELATMRPPVERYILVTVEFDGGSVFGGLAYEDEDDLNTLREECRSSLEFIVSRAPWRIGLRMAKHINIAFRACADGSWPGRAWWLEVWNEREALSQTYAPWGKPRNR